MSYLALFASPSSPTIPALSSQQSPLLSMSAQVPSSPTVQQAPPPPETPLTLMTSGCANCGRLPIWPIGRRAGDPRSVGGCTGTGVRAHAVYHNSPLELLNPDYFRRARVR